MWYVWFGILSEAMISNMKGIMMGLAPGIYSLYQIHIYTVYNIYIYSCPAATTSFLTLLFTVEEEWKRRQRQRSWLLFGGQNLLNSLPRQLFCTRTILENRMNSSFSSNHPGVTHSSLQIVLMDNSCAARNLMNSDPQITVTIFAFYIYSSSIRYTV